MSDDIEPTDEKPVKKKGKLGKKLVLGVGVLALLGGGVGAGLYRRELGPRRWRSRRRRQAQARAEKRAEARGRRRRRKPRR